MRVVMSNKSLSVSLATLSIPIFPYFFDIYLILSEKGYLLPDEIIITGHKHDDTFP